MKEVSDSGARLGGSTVTPIRADSTSVDSNAPGVEIFPGELAKGLKILADGGEVDYVGASAVELIGPGESAGNYRQVITDGGKMTTVKYR
jgi:branched-chain amino acid transport system substrate-binding protein